MGRSKEEHQQQEPQTEEEKYIMKQQKRRGNKWCRKKIKRKTKPSVIDPTPIVPSDG